ncbi:putative entry exclusion protein TrbK-alt [Pleomorphomonas koreensis]|uniref:putative entry exclusion protein TrbK-alt n=1 Tax=Pleomorphomonas koreensis TaxID=257440 RepID=UPI0003F5C036|nr:putative entry exclusion protein TrbK-alt [Pleomorphomonas koreensis]
MDGKILARLCAVAFVAIAIVAMVTEIKRSDDRQDGFAAETRPVRKRDHLDTELSRCSSLGEAGSRDASCLKAWAENRRRFLGQTDPAASSAPAAPTTLFPNAPGVADQPDPVAPITSQAGEH